MWFHVCPKCIDCADDLVTGNERELRWMDVAFDDVKIGVAHAADVYADSYFAGTGRGDRHIFETKRLTFGCSVSVKNHGAHGGSLALIALPLSHLDCARESLGTILGDPGSLF